MNAPILAIDPGPVRSAWLFLGFDGTPTSFGLEANESVLDLLARIVGSGDGGGFAVVIERVESYGMAVGAEVFDTVWWSGRFAQAVQPVRVVRLPRREVKLALCGSPRAKDTNIRQALLDRFGGASAQGTKAHPGPLYGISKDVWSALAIAVTYAERIS